MSELKAETFYLERESGERYAVEFYIKYDADKVLAEKNKDIQRLENLCESYRIDCDNLAIREANACKEIERDNKQIRHNKYKRCLAMAKACHEKSERMYCEASTAKSLNEILGKVPKDAVVEKFELWGAIASTHRKIWLALADEPTWAKFLQLIRKEAK